MISGKFIIGVLVALLLLLPRQAHALDPFALLYDDEYSNFEENTELRDENFVLVRLVLGDSILDDSFRVNKLDQKICVPLIELTEAIGFKLTVEDGEISGWTVSPDDKFKIDLKGKSGFSNDNLGWCATIKSLESIFPLKLDYSQSTLTLEVAGTSILPIEAKLERAKRRKLISKDYEPEEVTHRIVKNPYSWLSWPSVDIVVNSKIQNGQPLETVSNIVTTADLMKLTAKMSGNVQNNGKFKPTKFSLFRGNDENSYLGPFEAKHVEIGDISAPSQPLFGLSKTGRGIRISNELSTKPDEFDQTTIRGHLPINWEVELYRGSNILAFQTESNALGEYVFENVSLHSGYNRLTLKFFGPNGEIKKQTISKFVGSEFSIPGRLTYDIGFIDPNNNIFNLGTRKPGQENNNNAVSISNSAFASLSYGLPAQKAIVTDIWTNNNKTFASVGLAASTLGGYGEIKIGSEGRQRPAVQGYFVQKPTFSSTLSVMAKDFGGQRTEANIVGIHKVDQQAEIQFSSQIKPTKLFRTFETDLFWEKLSNERQSLKSTIRLGGQFLSPHSHWSNELKISTQSNLGWSVEGQTLISGRPLGVRSRASLTYRCDNNCKIDQGYLAVQNRFGQALYTQGTISYDNSKNVYALEASSSRKLEDLALSSNVRVSSQGDWEFGVGLSFSLFVDESTKSYKVSTHGMATSGVIAPRVFIDLDNDGIYTSKDEIIENAKFVVGDSLRPEKGNELGVTRVSKLPVSSMINSELQLSSISDPFLRPKEIVRSMILRPGKVLSYDVPMYTVAEAEGVLSVNQDGVISPVAGVEIEAIDARGTVVGTAVSEYDGFFYFQSLPMTEITFRLSEAAFQRVGGTLNPITIKPTSENPIAVGVVLNIRLD